MKHVRVAVAGSEPVAVVVMTMGSMWMGDIGGIQGGMRWVLIRLMWSGGMSACM